MIWRRCQGLLIGPLSLAFVSCGASDNAANQAELSSITTLYKKREPINFVTEGLRSTHDGRLLIDSQTMQCVAVRIVDTSLSQIPAMVGAIDLKRAFERVGQPPYLHGSPRRNTFGPSCKNDGHNIIIQWSLLTNGQHEPYILKLSVRQGKNSWIGWFTRNFRRPDSMAGAAPPEVGDGPCCDPSLSINKDAIDLSVAFENDLLGDLK